MRVETFTEKCSDGEDECGDDECGDSDGKCSGDDDDDDEYMV